MRSEEGFTDGPCARPIAEREKRFDARYGCLLGKRAAREVALVAVDQSERACRVAARECATRFIECCELGVEASWFRGCGRGRGRANRSARGGRAPRSGVDCGRGGGRANRSA